LARARSEAARFLPIRAILNETPRSTCSEVSGVVAAFAPSFKGKRQASTWRGATECAVYDTDGAGAAGKTEHNSFVTHVDGSARPQTVEKEINPLYWRLIDEFGNAPGTRHSEHLVQFARRSHRAHADRRDTNIF